MKNKVNVIQLYLSGRLFFVAFSGMFSFFVKKILSSLHFNCNLKWSCDVTFETGISKKTIMNQLQAKKIKNKKN